ATGGSLYDYLAGIEAECGGAPLGFEDGGIASADLNGDGRADYVLDMGRVTCGGENRAMGWCGSGGCAFDIFVSRGEIDYQMDSFTGGEPEIVRRGEGLAVASAGRDGPWAAFWNGSAMEVTHISDPAGGGSSVAAPGDDEAAIRAVVSSIYDVYAAGWDSDVAFPENIETDSLMRAIDAASDPEMG